MIELHTKYSATVTELKSSPSSLLEEAGDEPVAILNHNKPMAYFLSADSYQEIVEFYAKVIEYLDDKELSELAEKRLAHKHKVVRVSIDDL